MSTCQVSNLKLNPRSCFCYLKKDVFRSYYEKDFQQGVGTLKESKDLIIQN